MIARRIALVFLLVMATPWAVGAVGIEPLEVEPSVPDLHLENRIAELERGLLRLERQLDATVVDRAAPPSLGALSPRLRSALRLERRLAAWHRAWQSGHPVRSEVQLLALFHTLDAERRSLEVDLAALRGSPTERSTGSLRPRNGTGTFSGTVTAEGSGAPLGGVAIDVFDDSGNWVATATTVGDGGYVTPALGPGTYFAYTVELTLGYVNELWDDVPCHFLCDVTSGTPIVVTAGGDTADVDFALALGGRIGGTVRDADTDALLPDVIVDLFDASGRWVANPASGGSGAYLSPGLPAGDYYATTFNDEHYLDERWDDQACPFGCDPTAGTAIAVTVGATTGGIDFDLAPGGAIAGRVTESDGTTAIVGAWVRLFDVAGTPVLDVVTGAAGAYLTSRGLPAGSYHARTDNDLRYREELWQEIDFVGACDVTSGDPIAVSGTATVSDIDFTLARGGSIAGTVTEEGTALPIAGVRIDVFDDQGRFLDFALSDGDGDWQLGTGLPPGSYFAKTVGPQPYVNVLWDGVVCPTWCTITDGTAIVVAGTATTGGIDFVLGRGGRVAGSVTAAAGTTALEGVWVDLFDDTGQHVAQGRSDAAGAWQSWTTLPPGDYFARSWNDLGYVDQLFQRLLCAGGCDVTLGRVIPVFSTAVTTGIDFELAAGSVLAGTVREQGTLAPIENVSVEVWDEQGSWRGGSASDATGGYRTAALPAGRYHLRTWNDQGWVDQLHAGISCLGCVPTGGDPVELPGTTAVDFTLARGGRITGSVTVDGSGTPIADVHVELWSTSGRLLAWQATDALGEYALERIPAGSYHLQTWNGGDWIDEVWQDSPCGACDATSGTPVTVVAGSTLADVDFALAAGGAIAGTVTIDEQAIVDRIRVHVHELDGGWVGSTRAAADGSWAVGGLPTGSYRVRTANGVGYVDEMYADVACVGDCDLGAGSAVAVVAGATTPGVDFDLALGGRFAGTVTAAATGLPIDDAEVWFFDGSGTRRLITRVGVDGRFRSWGAVPPGTYWATTRNLAAFYDELYSETPCIGGELCAVTSGTPIVVTAGSVAAGIDFTLESGGGWIEGSVTDARWSVALSDVEVGIHDASGQRVTSVLWGPPRDAVGRFRSCGLPAGTYFLRTDSSELRVPYRDEVFDDRTCVGDCDVTLGTPVVVATATATTGVDFRLEPESTLIFADDFESGTAGAWSVVVGAAP